MKEILEKIKKQFPDVKGIAIIGVDTDNELKDQKIDKMEDKEDENPKEEIKPEFVIGDTVRVPVVESPEMCVSEIFIDVSEEITEIFYKVHYFDVNQHLCTETFNELELERVFKLVED